jgi:asparagine synthase (glutamine-hydrolysing)
VPNPPEHPVPGVDEPATAFTAPVGAGWPAEPLDQAVLTDWLTYLPDDILVKVDRAAMAVSLETRVPLLDRRVIELAWRLPRRLKERDGTTKWILREVLARHLPRRLFERPKRGFTAPIGSWIRGELRPWVTDLLAGARLRREGLIDAARVETRLREHLRGERDWGWPLWSVVTFEAWLAAQRESPRACAPAHPALDRNVPA